MYSPVDFVHAWPRTRAAALTASVQQTRKVAGVIWTEGVAIVLVTKR